MLWREGLSIWIQINNFLKLKFLQQEESRWERLQESSKVSDEVIAGWSWWRNPSPGMEAALSNLLNFSPKNIKRLNLIWVRITWWSKRGSRIRTAKNSPLTWLAPAIRSIRKKKSMSSLTPRITPNGCSKFILNGIFAVQPSSRSFLITLFQLPEEQNSMYIKPVGIVHSIINGPLQLWDKLFSRVRVLFWL